MRDERRLLAGLMIGFAATLTGCPDFDEMAHKRDLSWRGLTEDDLNGPETPTAVRARILNDVRTNRGLADRSEEGSPNCPPELKLQGASVLFLTDNTALSVITLRTDSFDRQFPISETAYYHDKRAIYYYHYVGGPDRRDVWMGPFPTRLKPRSGD